MNTFWLIPSRSRWYNYMYIQATCIVGKTAWIFTKILHGILYHKLSIIMLIRSGTGCLKCHFQIFVNLENFGFVGDLCSYQKTPFKKFCDKQFSCKLRTQNLSFKGCCTSCVWVGRSKLIWVVNPMIVFGYVMSKWKFFYQGRNSTFLRIFGIRGHSIKQFESFLMGSHLAISLTVADIFWLISTRSRWGTWVHTWSMYHFMYLG